MSDATHQNMLDLLIEHAKQGNYKELKNLIDTVDFSEYEIDLGFRECIKNFKDRNEKFVNSIKLFLDKTNLNYQNPKFNGTTILMYSLELGKETPAELMLYDTEGLDPNLLDNNRENCIFKLIKNDKINVDTQCGLLEQLLTDKIDFNFQNKNGESINSLIEQNKNKVKLKKIVDSCKLNNEKYLEMLLKDDYSGIVIMIKNFKDKRSYYSKENIQYLYNYTWSNIYKSYNNSKKNKNINDKYKLFNPNIEEYQIDLVKILNDIQSDSYLPSNHILIINKLFLYYQLDFYYSFIKFYNDVQKNYELFEDKFIYFYMNIIFIDILIERNKIKEASVNLNNLDNNLNYFKLSFNLNNTNNSSNHTDNDNDNYLVSFFNKYDIFNPDNRVDFNILIKLYNIYISLFEIKNSNSSSSNSNSKIITNNKIKELIENLNSINITKNNSNLIYNFYNYLNICLTYFISHFSLNKLYIELDKLYNENISSSSTSYNYSTEINDIFIYNSYGILSLKSSNYQLAIFFFLKCLKIIKESTPNQYIKINHYYPNIIYNLSLTYFYLKQYDKCAKLLKKLISKNKSNSYIITNKYIFYRLGLAELEITLQNYNYKGNDMYYYNKNDCFILNKKIKNLIIKNEIILNFKKVLNILNSNPNNDKSKNNLYFNSCLNIIFCLIVNKNYTEALFYLTKKIKGNDQEQENIINFNIMQCFLQLNNPIKALKQSEKIIIKNNENFNVYIKPFFDNLNEKIISKNINFKLSCYANMVILCVMNKQYNKIKHILNSILENLNVLNINKNNLPPFILNAFLFYFIYNGQNDISIKLMKNRQVNFNFLNEDEDSENGDKND